MTVRPQPYSFFVILGVGGLAIVAATRFAPDEATRMATARP